jgi:hypothetical protein
VEPDRYCVIDFRGWRALFKEDQRLFDVVHYNRYLREVRRLATELAWPVQEVDLAIWAYDQQGHHRAV